MDADWEAWSKKDNDFWERKGVRNRFLNDCRAVVVSFGLFGDIVRVGLNRPVWSGVGEVPEPGSRRIGIVKELQQIVGECVGRVEVGRKRLDDATIADKPDDRSLLLP